MRALGAPVGGLYPPGDAAALAERLAALWHDPGAGERGLAVVREWYSPAAVAAQLHALYDGRDSVPSAVF